MRTDQHLHRVLPEDSALARSISVLARGYQDAVWRRTKIVQELRARLREYYPGFLVAFASGAGSGRGLSTTQLAGADARAVLAISASPAEGLKVSKARVETALRRGGRQRRISSLATKIINALRVPQLRQDPIVEQAMRVETLALLGVLDAICASVDQLTGALIEAFAQHPDYKIITSFPGLADVSGAIVLAEIGDDRSRFRDGRAVQAFARLRAGHPGFGQVPHRNPATHQEQPARRHRLLLGLHRRRTPLPGPGPLPNGAGPEATGTQPHCGTCSTRCSTSSTTACKPGKPTTRPRPSHTSLARRNRTRRAGLCLTSWQHRRSQALGGPLGGRGDGPVAVAKFIAAQRDHGIPHATGCRALGVSQGWFYKWRDGDPSAQHARRSS